MLLGGTVVAQNPGVNGWEDALIRSRFKTITAPFHCEMSRDLIENYCDIIHRHHVSIAEIGIWRNPMDPNPEKAREVLNYSKRQLKLADELKIPCCVNIVGTSGSSGWDAADSENFTQETYQRIIRLIQEIIDDVNPVHTFYCIEPMPWMIPDSPDSYLQLIHDVNRRAFAVHMDFVNMINCPRRYLAAEQFIEECFAKLGRWIKSTHIKDTKMHPTRLTTILEECSPGEGSLNWANVLRILDKYLPQNAPILLEHMQTFDEYAAAYQYVSQKALEAGIPL